MDRIQFKVGSGVVCWGANERHSGRYGVIQLLGHTFNGKPAASKLDPAVLDRFEGKRVHMTCRIVKGRQSPHPGDMFLDVHTPKGAPKKGTVVDLGVGYLSSKVCDYDANVIDILLQPRDSRQDLWMDPRKLYQLHDQTVELFVEETEESCTPKADLVAKEDGAILMEDNSYQVRGVKTGEKFGILPSIEKVEGENGMFIARVGVPGHYKTVKA